MVGITSRLWNFNGTSLQLAHYLFFCFFWGNLPPWQQPLARNLPGTASCGSTTSQRFFSYETWVSWELSSWVAWEWCVLISHVRLCVLLFVSCWLNFWIYGISQFRNTHAKIADHQFFWSKHHHHICSSQNHRWMNSCFIQKFVSWAQIPCFFFFFSGFVSFCNKKHGWLSQDIAWMSQDVTENDETVGPPDHGRRIGSRVSWTHHLFKCDLWLKRPWKRISLSFGK